MDKEDKRSGVWMHCVPAGFRVPLDPERKVFGSEKDGYFVISSYTNGSFFIVQVVDTFAFMGGRLELILTRVVKELYESDRWQYAREIWPSQYVRVDMKSQCCSGEISISTRDGLVSDACDADVARVNSSAKVFK